MSNFKNEEREISKRLKHLFFSYFIVGVVGVVYLFIYLFIPNLRIPCLFNSITRLNCPGCGISRMLASFAKFNFIDGVKYNYFLAFTMPIIVMLVIYYSYSYVNRKKIKFFEIAGIIYLVLLIIWGVFRNFFGL